jgi:hypothetical protein
MSGVNIKTVSDIMGHSSASFTMEFYGHVFPATRREAADILSALLNSRRDAV